MPGFDLGTGTGEMTPEEEDEIRRRAEAHFQSGVVPPAQQPNLALLQADPGQRGGVNMMPPPLPSVVSSLPGGSPGPDFTPDEDARMRDLAAHHDDVSPLDAAPPPPPAPPTSPALPPVTQQPRSTGGGTSSGGKLSNDLAASIKESTAAAGQVGDAKIATAGAANDAAQADAVAKEQAAAERLQAKQASAAEATRLTAKADAEDAKYKSMSYQDFWSKATVAGKPDTATGARLVGWVSMAFGAAGASLTGGPNYAMENIDKLIDRDYKRQKDIIEKQRDVVNEARGLAKDAKAEKLLSLEAWRKAAYEAVEAKGKATLAAMGPQAATADKAAIIAAVHEKAQESKHALEKGIAMIANTRADTALKGAEIGKVKAETEKDYAAAKAAGLPKDSEKGIKDARQRAMLVTGLEDQDKIVRQLEGNGVRLTEKDLQQIQDNRTYLAAAQHGDKSVLDALGIVYARKWGSVPRTEFDGLRPAQKRLAGAYNQITQKAALLNAGAMTTEAISHAASAVDLLAPNQGPEEHERRKTYIRTDLIGANKGMVPGMVDKARGGADAVQSNPNLDDSAAVQWAKANPGNEKAKRILQLNGL